MRTIALAFLVAAAAGCAHDEASRKPPTKGGLVDHEAELHQHMIDTHSAAAPVDGGAGDGP